MFAGNQRQTMAYNHHRKAGNEGDCVKHPALIAALDVVLESQARSVKLFSYLDAFSGHAWHPLLDEGGVSGVQQELEWRNGIGKLRAKLWAWTRTSQTKLDPSVRKWRDWYLPRRPSLVRGWYPGSSVIAADMCRKYNRAFHFTLFDTSEEVRCDLGRFFCPIQPTSTFTRTCWCVVGSSLSPASIKIKSIQKPDFVFIDPPGWRSKDNSSYPKWEEFLEYVLKPRAKTNRPTLLWMPAGGQSVAHPWGNLKKSKLRDQCRDVRTAGYRWTAVRWGQHHSYRNEPTRDRVDREVRRSSTGSDVAADDLTSGETADWTDRGDAGIRVLRPLLARQRWWFGDFVLEGSVFRGIITAQGLIGTAGGRHKPFEKRTATFERGFCPRALTQVACLGSVRVNVVEFFVATMMAYVAISIREQGPRRSLFRAHVMRLGRHGRRGVQLREWRRNRALTPRLGWLPGGASVVPGNGDSLSEPSKSTIVAGMSRRLTPARTVRPRGTPAGETITSGT